MWYTCDELFAARATKPYWRNEANAEAATPAAAAAKTTAAQAANNSSVSSNSEGSSINKTSVSSSSDVGNSSSSDASADLVVRLFTFHEVLNKVSRSNCRGWCWQHEQTWFYKHESCWLQHLLRNIKASSAETKVLLATNANKQYFVQAPHKLQKVQIG